MQKMTLRSRISGSKGLSLAGVMAGVAVGSILALGVAQVVSNAFSGQKLVEFRENVKNIKYEMIGILSLRQNCTQTFLNINPITNTQPERTQIFNNGSASFQVYSGTGPVFSGNTVRVLRYYFKTGVQSDFVMVDPVERKGMVSLYVEFLANNPRLGGVTNIVHSIKLSVDLNASDRIESCIAAGNDEDSLWKLAGSLGIFYQANPGPTRVGIGTNGPIEALDLHGFLKVERGALATTGGTISAGLELNALLFSAGTVQSATFRSASFLHNSDHHLKAEISPLKKWQEVLFLNGVQFTWKTRPEQPVFGFIGQEVQKVYPAMVHQSPDSGELSIEEFQLMAPLIEGIKSLNQRQKTMEMRMDRLQDRLTRSRPQR